MLGVLKAFYSDMDMQLDMDTPITRPSMYCLYIYGSIFGKRDLLAIDHIMLALF